MLFYMVLYVFIFPCNETHYASFFEWFFLKKSISILIADYELDELKEIPKYITKWNVREEDYSKIILTDVMEIYINLLTKVKYFLAGFKNILSIYFCV